MTTTSACRSTVRPNNSALLISLRTSDFRSHRGETLTGFDENRRGMFEVVADRLDERGAHVAIDHAVVERARQVHHLPNRDPVVPDDGSLFDLVHAEDGDLGPVDDWCREDAAFLTERGDREGGPLDVLQGEFLVARCRGEPINFFREVPEPFLVGLVHNGDREALVRGRRDADVVVSFDDDLRSLVVDGGVQRREFHQRREDGFDEEREERELDPLALRGGFQMVAQVDELGHIDLFHIGEMSRRDVGLRHLLENPLAQPMNRDPLFAAGGRNGGGRRGHRGDASRGALSGFANVILGEATLRAAPSDRREIHVEFLREAADRGRREDLARGSGRRRGGRHARWRWSRRGSARLGSGRGHLARLAEHDEGVADLDDFAFFRSQLKDFPGDGRRDLDRHLVGHDLDDRVVLLDGVPFLHEPLDDLAFVDALPDVGELELAGHLLSLGVRRKPRGHLNILHLQVRGPLLLMRIVLWSPADVCTGRCGVVEEWHRPVGVICARRFAPARVPACSSFLQFAQEGETMARPLGITILGALVVLAAVSLILISIASFFVGLAFVLPFRETGTTLLLNALLYFVIGVVLAVAGSGLLRMRPWAWGLAILATLVTLVYVGYTAYQRSNAGEPLSLPAILTLVIVGVILVYLLSVSRAFRRPAGM